jgi:hypothetical protein
MDGEAMTTLVITVLLGGWALLFALLVLVPLLPAVPMSVRVEDVADTMARPLAPIGERRAAA